MVVLVMLVTTGFTVSTSVATESQPVALTKVSLYVTCSSNVDTVPCVWQCARTDGSVGSACYDWVTVSTR
jgi:hypothetical protein